jgi:hypothetical protein
LALVAEWLGQRMNEDGSPCPTGKDAAYKALGPMLLMDWDWPSEPTPAVILEGGPDEWAFWIVADDWFESRAKKLGVWCEPYAGYALCIYPADGA